MMHFLDSIERSSSGKLKLSSTDYSPTAAAAAAATLVNEHGHQSHVLGHVGRGNSKVGRETSSPSSSFSSRSSSDEEDLFQLSGTECYQPMVADVSASAAAAVAISPAQIGEDDAKFQFQHLLSDFSLEVDTSNRHNYRSNSQPANQQSPPVQSMTRRADDPTYIIHPSCPARKEEPGLPAPNEFLDKGRESAEHVYRDENPEATNGESTKMVQRRREAAADHELNSYKEEKPSATDNTVLSASTSRRSDCSTISANSFAFPILAGAGKFGSVNVESGQQQQQGGKLKEMEEEIKKADDVMAPAVVGRTSWCPCVTTCCSFRCCC